MPKVTVIIPAFNEEKDIAETVKRIKKVSKEYEVLVVDDGSTDQTSSKAKRAGARVVRHAKNQGKGAGMRTGARRAKGDILVFIDASQLYPEQIPELVARCKKGVHVVGKRPYHKMNWQRKLNNMFSIMAFFLATGTVQKDLLSGFRVIKKSDYKKLNIEHNDFRIEAEMTYGSLKKGIKMVYVPVDADYPPTLTFNCMSWSHSFQEIAFLGRLVIMSWSNAFNLLKRKR